MPDDYIPVEKLLGATGGSIYKLAVLAAKRAMVLAGGEKPLVDKHNERLLDLALEEIEAKKIAEGKEGRQKKEKGEKDQAQKKEEKENPEEEKSEGAAKSKK